MQKIIKNLLERNATTIALSLTVIIAFLSLKTIHLTDEPITNLDKVFHFIAYFSLTIAWLFTYREKNKTLQIILLLFLYGVLLEFFQAWFTTSRVTDIFDVFANTIGIIFASLVFKYLYYLATKTQNNEH